MFGIPSGSLLEALSYRAHFFALRPNEEEEEEKRLTVYYNHNKT